MGQILTEDAVGLAEAAQALPGRNGGRVNQSTVQRWIRHGIRRPDGTVVRLEAVRLGRRWITSKQAVARFVAALSPSADPPAPAPAAERREVVRG